MLKYKKKLSVLITFILVFCLIIVPKTNVSAHAWDGIVSQDSDYYYYDGHYYEYCYNYADANGAADIQGVTYEHQYAKFNISQPRPARYLWSKDDANGDRCIGGGAYLAKDYGFDCYANYWDGDVFATVPSSWFYQNGITYMKKAHAYYKRTKTTPSHKNSSFPNIPYYKDGVNWVKPNTQFNVSITGTQSFPGTQLQLDDHVKYNCLRLQSSTTEMRVMGKDDGACTTYQSSPDLIAGVISYNKGNYYGSFSCDMTTQFGVTAYKDNQDYDVYDYIESYNGKNSSSWVSLGKVKTDGTAPMAESIDLTNTTENSSTINVNSVTDNNRSGVKSVSLQVWTSSDKSDLETLTSSKSGDGTYSYTLNFSKHGGKSKTYNMIAVMTDNVGNVGQMSKSTSLTSKNSIETQYIDESTNMSISSSDVQNVDDGTYNVGSNGKAKPISGYTPTKYVDNSGAISNYDSSKTYQDTVTNGVNHVVKFKYSKDNTPTPPIQDLKAPVAHINAPAEVHEGTLAYVTGYGTDPQGLKITEYEWSSSTGDTITGTGGTINVSGTATVTLRVKNEKDMWSDTVTATIGAVNHPPTVYLQTPFTVIMGDDVPVNAYGSDIDGDPLYYIWNNPSDFLGSCNGTSGIGYFNTIGNKYFTVTAYDPFGASASASSSVNVIAPIPNVLIDKSGTEKENRKITLDAEKFSSGGSKKFPIDWTKTTWEFFDANGNKLSLDNNPTSNTIIKSLDSTTGTKGMNLIVKQQGKYKVRCSVINTAGYTNYADITLNISPDIVPISDFDLPGTGIRDLSDPSPHGLAQATTILTDNCSSRDNDVIAKRMWVGAWDSDNDGSYIWITKNEDGTTKATPTYERWYVYDLDYNGSTDTQQNGLSDSLNPHWRYVGNYNDAKNLDINTINCGNLVSVQFKSTSVGRYDFEETVKEEFGQETIPELTTINDRKQATTWGVVK